MEVRGLKREGGAVGSGGSNGGEVPAAGIRGATRGGPLSSISNFPLQYS